MLNRYLTAHETPAPGSVIERPCPPSGWELIGFTT
jgi:hypothetical protein